MDNIDHTTWGSVTPANDYTAVAGGFHRGYANTLKVITYIFTFGLPGILFLISAAASRGNLGPLILSLLGCALLAFVLWISFSFLAKFFDLVSKTAMTNDMILQELRKQNREEK